MYFINPKQEMKKIYRKYVYIVYTASSSSTHVVETDVCLKYIF